MRVLIVDDSRTIRGHLCMMMQSLGWETEEADSGINALQKLRADKDFDLTLMDVIMPEMDGVECARRVRDEMPGLDMKLMMVTTQSDFPLIANVLSHGADEFLIKPFTRGNMLGKLRLMDLPFVT